MTTEVVTLNVSPEAAVAFRNASADTHLKLAKALEWWVVQAPEASSKIPSLSEAIQALQEESVRKGTHRITPEEIEAEIQAVRRQRRA